MKLNYRNIKPLIKDIQKDLIELEQLLHLLAKHTNLVKAYSTVRLEKEKNRLRRLFKEYKKTIVEMCPHKKLTEFCILVETNNILAPDLQFYRVCNHCGLKEAGCKNTKRFGYNNIFKMLTAAIKNNYDCEIGNGDYCNMQNFIQNIFK